MCKTSPVSFAYAVSTSEAGLLGRSAALSAFSVDMCICIRNIIVLSYLVLSPYKLCLTAFCSKDTSSEPYFVVPSLLHATLRLYHRSAKANCCREEWLPFRKFVLAMEGTYFTYLPPRSELHEHRIVFHYIRAGWIFICFQENRARPPRWSRTSPKPYFFQLHSH